MQPGFITLEKIFPVRKQSSVAGFTPLDNASDKVGGKYLGEDGGLKPPSGNTVRERSSLTGFTLMELVVVIIIIGILATIALPLFLRVAEKGRASEGAAILGALKSAQLRYAIEHGITATDIANLDMNVTSLKYFAIQPLPGQIIVYDSSNTSSIVASVTRNDHDNSSFGTYTLSIAVNGNITCSGGESNICKLLGYKTQ